MLASAMLESSLPTSCYWVDLLHSAMLWLQDHVYIPTRDTVIEVHSSGKNFSGVDDNNIIRYSLKGK